MDFNTEYRNSSRKTDWPVQNIFPDKKYYIKSIRRSILFIALLSPELTIYWIIVAIYNTRATWTMDLYYVRSHFHLLVDTIFLMTRAGNELTDPHLPYEILQEHIVVKRAYGNDRCGHSETIVSYGTYFIYLSILYFIYCTCPEQYWNV